LLSKAAAVAEYLTTLAPHPKAFLRAASIYAQLQDRPSSTRLLKKWNELFPGAPGLQAALSESLGRDKDRLEL